MNNKVRVTFIFTFLLYRVIVIKTSMRTGQLNSSTAENTTFFVETMNNFFDAFNSKRIRKSNPYKIPRGKLTRPDSFDGFLLTINAV